MSVGRGQERNRMQSGTLELLRGALFNVGLLVG